MALNLKPSRFLRPTSDLVFKRVFGENPNIVKSFLNSVLPLPEDAPIETIEYLPTEEVPRIPAFKCNIVDVKCQDSKGRIFVVEMQTTWSINFYKRFLFTSSRAVVQQLRKGEDYESMCPVYGLAIVNDVFDKESPDWYHHYKIINVERPERVLEGLEMIFLELPKFTPRDWSERKLGIKWLRYLREIDEYIKEVPEGLIGDPDIEHALELAQESGYTEGQLDTYDKYVDSIRSHNTLMKDARNAGLQEGREVGLAIGLKEGLEKGKEVGLKEGEQRAKRELAKKLIAFGISLDDIITWTGLSREIIEKL